MKEHVNSPELNSVSVKKPERLAINAANSGMTGEIEHTFDKVQFKSTSSKPIQLAGGLTRKQRAVVARNAAKRNGRREKQRQAELLKSEKLRQARITRAEAGFNEMINGDTQDSTVDQYKFPFDKRDLKKGDRALTNPAGMGQETIGEAMERMPHEVRTSAGFIHIVTLPDSAHGQGERRDKVKKGELQEALAGWQYTKEASLDAHSTKPAGEIDYIAANSHGQKVPFDPFMSPMAGPGKVASDASMNRWAQADKDGSYYKHTHSKGGNPDTVGVWDKTYTSGAQEQLLKNKLQATNADQGAKVHELRVPLGRMYAEEHVRAEDQIAKRNAEREKRRKRQIQKQIWKAQNRARQQQLKSQIR